MRRSAARIAQMIQTEVAIMEKRKTYIEQMTSYLNDRIRELNKVKGELEQENKWIEVSNNRIAELAEREKLIKMQDIVSCLNSQAQRLGGQKDSTAAQMTVSDFYIVVVFFILCAVYRLCVAISLCLFVASLCTLLTSCYSLLFLSFPLLIYRNFKPRPRLWKRTSPRSRPTSRTLAREENHPPRSKGSVAFYFFHRSFCVCLPPRQLTLEVGKCTCYLASRARSRWPLTRPSDSEYISFVCIRTETSLSLFSPGERCLSFVIEQQGDVSFLIFPLLFPSPPLATVASCLVPCTAVAMFLIYFHISSTVSFRFARQEMGVVWCFCVSRVEFRVEKAICYVIRCPLSI